MPGLNLSKYTHSSAEPSAPHMHGFFKTHTLLKRACVDSKMSDCMDSHTVQEVVYLCNGAVSEKSTRFLLLLPVEYVILFSG